MDKYLIVVFDKTYAITVDDGSLEQLQYLVGGHIESVNVNNLIMRNNKNLEKYGIDLHAWINDDGKNMFDEVTFLLGYQSYYYDLVYGPVVLCVSYGPETFGFRWDQLQLICNQLDNAGYCYSQPDKVEK